MGWRDTQAGVESGAINFAPKKVSPLEKGFASLLDAKAKQISVSYADKREQRLRDEDDARKRRPNPSTPQRGDNRNLSYCSKMGDAVLSKRNQKHQGPVID